MGRKIKITKQQVQEKLNWFYSQGEHIFQGGLDNDILVGMVLRCIFKDRCYDRSHFKMIDETEEYFEYEYIKYENDKKRSFRSLQKNIQWSV